MGLPYSGDPLSQYCQDRGHPLPSSLPGVRRLITEQQGGDGACVVLGHRREVGETGERVTNFLQRDRWQSEAERKKW